MVTWEDVEEAERIGRDALDVPCYRIDARAPITEPVGRRPFSRHLDLIRAGKSPFLMPPITTPVSVTLLRLALKEAPDVVSDIDLPSQRQRQVWQVIALNREAALIMLLGESHGLEIPFRFQDDLVWLKPIPDVWPAGTEEWALVAMYT